MERLKLCLFLLVIPVAYGGVPGTFFWKPRLGLDLAIPTTAISTDVRSPTKQNVQDGLVVLIEGYQAGMTIVALAAGISSAQPYPTLNPMSNYFYTNSYRWALRHLSLMPFWLGGNGAYCHTHKVWKRRFFYMDEFIPKWMRYIFPHVSEKEWEREEKDFKRFKKVAEPAFGKYYRYPSKKFNNFKSLETEESPENLEQSDTSSIS